MSKKMDDWKLMHMNKALIARDGKKIKLRWNTPTSVRRSLAKVNNMLLNREIEPKEANALYYSANLVLKAIELENAENEQRESREKVSCELL